MSTYEGNLIGTGLKFGIVVTRFNELLSSRLLVRRAWTRSIRHGVAEADIDVAWVPGAFEIPLVAEQACRSRAATTRSSRSASSSAAARRTSSTSRPRSARASRRSALDTGVPVMFGVITADTIEQAVERAGTKAGNKGWEAAEAAIEMANLVKAMG